MRILFIANTPFELYYVSSVACLLGERDKNLKAKLLLRRQIEHALTPEISNLYSEVEIIEFPTLTFPLGKNPVKLIRNFFINLRQTISFRSYLKRDDFNFDAICISSFREFFANMICRYVPQKTRLVALRMANQKIDLEIGYKKRPVLSFFVNVKNFFFGYSRIEYKFRLDCNEAEKNYIKYPYHRTISITDWNIGASEDKKEYRLPPPFVALKKVYKAESEPEGILVAGEPTPLHPSWGKVDQEKYEIFFEFLRNNFREYRIYFKPRMVFQNVGDKMLTDTSAFNLKDFHIISARVSFEELCLKKNIKKVISISSTASKVGAYFGIPSYMIFPLFRQSKFWETGRAYFELYFDDMKSIIRVDNLNDLMASPQLFTEEYNFDDLSSLYWKAIVE